MVVVEGFFDRDEDAHVGLGNIGSGVVVPVLGVVVAWEGQQSLRDSISNIIAHIQLCGELKGP